MVFVSGTEWKVCRTSFKSNCDCDGNVSDCDKKDTLPPDEFFGGVNSASILLFWFDWFAFVLLPEGNRSEAFDEFSRELRNPSVTRCGLARLNLNIEHEP